MKPVSHCKNTNIPPNGSFTYYANSFTFFSPVRNPTEQSPLNLPFIRYYSLSSKIKSWNFVFALIFIHLLSVYSLFVPHLINAEQTTIGQLNICHSTKYNEKNKGVDMVVYQV